MLRGPLGGPEEAVAHLLLFSGRAGLRPQGGAKEAAVAEEDKTQEAQQKAKKGKKDEAAEAKPEKAKGKLPLKKIIIGVVALVVLGGGGFFAWQTFMAPKGEEAAKAAEEPVAEEVILSHKLDPFIVNLVDPLGRRYLKVQIELELDSPPTIEETKKHDSQIRDAIITLLTSKSYGDVDSPEGKVQLRQEIISRVNQFLRRGKAQNAYFTDFVVQ